MIRRPNLKTCCKRILPVFLLAATMFYLGIMTVQNHISWRSHQRSVRRAGGPWMVFAGQDQGGGEAKKQSHKKVSILEESNEGSVFHKKTNPNHSRRQPLRPHIILITVSDLGWNDVGYNNDIVKTPSIDSLAADGVKLDNYYVQNQGAPSKAEILTGKIQTHTGVADNIHPSETFCLPSNKVIMPRVLKDAGYATHLVGQWGLGHSARECTPTFRGYDTFYGSLTSFADHLSHVVNWTPRYPNAKELKGYDFYENERSAFEVRGHHTTDLLSQRAQRIITDHEDTNKPLFIDLSFPALTTNSDVPKRFSDIYRDVDNITRRNYLSMVSYVDEAIRNITDALKNNSMWQNSVLVFTSVSGGDPNDGGSNWPLRGWKGSYWDGGIRAVSFLHSPLLRSEVKGSVVQQLLSGIDWFPTLAGVLAGGQVSALYLDGLNIWGVINQIGRIPAKRTILHSVEGDCHVATYENITSQLIQSRMRKGAVRYGDWKLVVNYPGAAKFSFDWIPPAEMHLNVPQLKRPHYGKTIWLFRMNLDPVEKKNMVDLRVDITDKLLLKLWEYCITAEKSTQRFDDPYADPGLHGGVIGPWIV